MTQITEKTHWKKNQDSAFISGEDLKASLHGLKPEMIVRISSFGDAETYDQNKSEKKMITGLDLETLDGKKLYKPVILNKTNARFFVKETGSDFVDDWVGIPVYLYCQPDKRFGHVVRFRKYTKSKMEIGDQNFQNCKKAYLADPKILPTIKAKYDVSPEVEAALIKKD